MSSAPLPAAAMTHRARMAVLGAVMLGLFLSALDQTIVGTAMPRILSDLHGNDVYTWVVTAYLLSSTVTVPIYGKLGDVVGRKPMLLIGIGLFLVGSALAGLSQNVGQLITFRALQGLGAGALFPISLAVIGDLFTPRERGRYQGLFGAVFGLSFIIGPFLGGLLTDRISWHWVFYVNLPVGIVALGIIGTVLPTVKRAGSLRSLDYLGIGVFTAAIVPILLGLSNKGLTDSTGALNDWLSFPVGGLIGLGLALLVVFIVIEIRAEEPFFPLELFRDRTFAGSNAAVFLMAFAMFASVIFIPRYYQAVQGISATQSGYMVWPLLVGLISGSVTTGIIISRTGHYKAIMVGSSGLLVLGSFLTTHLTIATPDWQFWIWMGLMGLGIGPSMSGFTVVIQNAVPRERLGVATGTLTFLRQIGGSVGLALAGTLFSQGFTDRLQAASAGRIGGGRNSGLNDLTAVGSLHDTLARAGVPPAFIPRAIDTIHQAFALAVGEIFWLAVAAAVGGLVCTTLIKVVPLRHHAHPAPAPTAAAAVAAGEDEDEDEPVMAGTL